VLDRTIFLGSTNEATAGFFEDSIPVQSLNPSIYPAYVVKDSNGDLVTAGVGTFNAITTLFECSFQVPENAELSTDIAKYVISWELLSTTNKEYNITECFDVVSPSYDMSEAKERQKITLSMIPITLSIPLTTAPSTISFTVYDDNDTPIFNSTPTGAGTYTGYYIYDTTVPAGILVSGQQYGSVWRFTISGEESLFYQVLTCIDLYDLSLISSLRMYLDKVAKDVDLYVGYRDSDLYFHLKHGLSYINMITPITEWTTTNIKTSMNIVVGGWLAGAQWSALNAQYLAEGDSAFDYSGQPVTLTVDRTQYIESQIGRLKEWLDNDFKAWKTHYIRSQDRFALGLSYPSVGGSLIGMDQRKFGVPLTRKLSFQG